MTTDLVTRLKTCRNRSVPIVAVNTPDQQAFVECMTKALNGDTPAVQWDYARGMTPCNQLGSSALSEIDGSGECVGSPPFALGIAAQLPQMSVVFIHNAQRYLDDVAVIQSVANLRSPFAGSNRMLVLLGPFVNLPPELTGDVIPERRDR